MVNELLQNKAVHSMHLSSGSIGSFVQLNDIRSKINTLTKQAMVWSIYRNLMILTFKIYYFQFRNLDDFMKVKESDRLGSAQRFSSPF